MSDKIRLLPELEADLEVRRRRAADIMKGRGIGGMLVSSTANLYYLAGSVFRGYLYLADDATIVSLPVKGEAAVAVTSVRIRKPEMIADALASVGLQLPDVVGLECDSLTYNEYSRLRKCLAEAEIADVSPVLRESRMIKTAWEIARMRADGTHHVEAYRRIGRLYRENMTDIEFQIEIERVLRREGSLGFLRTAGSMMELNMGSVLAGENADTPSPYDFSMGGQGVDLSLPVGANGTVLKSGMTVMVDMNGNFNGYQTDLTRVWRIGDVSDLAMRAQKVSCEILEDLEAYSRPGVKISDMCERAYNLVRANGLEDYFMGHESQVGFIGHGVGIELNEQPVLMLRNKSELRENMTIAIEPKFVIPGVGAVGNENTYVVTASGLENLTPANPEMGDLI